MATNKKIGDLTAATTAALTDLCVLLVGGLARKMTLTNLKTVLGVLPFSGAVVKLTTNETLTTATAVPWDAAVYDDSAGDDWWTSGAATRLTVPAGVAKVRLTWNWNLTAVHADIQVWPEKNGSPVDGGGYQRGQGSVVGSSGGSAVIEVSEGDYFELFPTFSSGSPVFRSDTVGSTFFAIEKVA